MQENHENSGIVSNKTMDIVVALFFVAFGGLVMWDSYRIGNGWSADGPESGAFPFYVGLFIVLACVVTVINAIKENDQEGFVEAEQVKTIMQVLIPTIIYIIVSFYVGIYVASAVFITAFMKVLGKFSIVKSLAVGICVPVVLFFMFEVWFKVPLPKGPVEAMFGF